MNDVLSAVQARSNETPHSVLQTAVIHGLPNEVDVRAIELQIDLK